MRGEPRSEKKSLEKGRSGINRNSSENAKQRLRTRKKRSQN